MKMPQIMVETFAKDLIDKIMTEVFNVTDTNIEKLRTLENQEEPADIRSQSVYTTQEMHNHSSVDHIEPEITEFIESMVPGLRNLQIGDSTSVPPSLSNLEKQVKHAVSNIGSVSPADVTKSPEVHVPQGQGDVHEIIQDAIETSSEATCTRKEKDNCDSNEASGISSRLLYLMIEELETKTKEFSSKEENQLSSTCIEGNAAWEETEEQFIRTIESIDDPDEGFMDPKYESNSKNQIHELANGEHPPLHFLKNIDSEEITIEEIAPSSLPIHEEISLVETVSRRNARRSGSQLKSKSQKRKTILGRMRKLFRTFFGRRKN